MKNFIETINSDFAALKKQVEEIISGESPKERFIINKNLYYMFGLIKSVQLEPQTEKDLNTNTKKLFAVKNLMNSLQNWYYLKIIYRTKKKIN
jgi:hypothetical protein